jgi:hypothetical protein
MPSYDTHCLLSTVRNNLSTPMLFGFLPPHGRYLQPDEEYSTFGNILDTISVANLDRNSSRRWIQSFEAAINRGDLVIVKTPNPILEDTVHGTTKMISLVNNALVIAAPCWTEPGSIVDDDGGGEDFPG